jgi:hypothetical protein
VTPKLVGDGTKGIVGGMFVMVDMDQPKPNTSPIEYVEIGPSAYTANGAIKLWRSNDEK